MKLILSMRCFLLLLAIHLAAIPPGSAGHHKKLKRLLASMGYYGYRNPVAEPVCYSCVQPKPLVVYKPIPEPIPIPEPVCTSCVQPIRPQPCCRPKLPPCCDGYGYASGYYNSRGYTTGAFNSGYGAGGGGYYGGPQFAAGGAGGVAIGGGGGGGYGKRK